NDETRHVMTGVFARDALVDGEAWRHPTSFAKRYYLKYPALGLLVWPPLYYLVEGAFMLPFGTSFLAARTLVGLFDAWAVVTFYRLLRRDRDVMTASMAAILFGIAPLVVMFSRQVMLELPALAFALAAVFHFERYLSDERPRDAIFACLAA